MVVVMVKRFFKHKRHLNYGEGMSYLWWYRILRIMVVVSRLYKWTGRFDGGFVFSSTPFVFLLCLFIMNMCYFDMKGEIEERKKIKMKVKWSKKNSVRIKKNKKEKSWEILLTWKRKWKKKVIYCVICPKM